MACPTYEDLELKIQELSEEIRSLRQREKALEEAKNYYHAFFENGSDGVLILDPETTKAIDFNDQVCLQLGYSREEFSQLRLVDIEVKEDADKIQTHVQDIIKDGFDSFETLHRTKNGEVRQVHVLAQVIAVGSRPVYHCIWRDITNQKRREEELRESEEKFSLTFNFNPDAVSISRLEDDLFVDVNEGFSRITGFTREEVVGKTSLELNLWADPANREILVQSHREKGFHDNFEATFCRKDGKSFTGLMSTRVITLKGVPHIITISRDISLRKQHERELLKIEKLESLGILAGGIAHDFNNILTGIIGNISLAKIFLGSDHKSAKPLIAAEKATARAGELAHQLLTFARGGEPIKKVISTHHIIDEALSLVLHGSNVKAIVDIADSIQSFEADEGQISQVLHNIIINAQHAMPGGGELTIIARNKTLCDDNTLALLPGQYLCLTIADQGCGIPGDEITKIFDPYFTTKPTGNGLGLASAYSIIKKHGGHIGVSSVIGESTTFTIHLPSTGEQYPQQPAVLSSQAKSLQHCGSVLVMDDEAVVREIAESMLNHLGFKVTTCDHGKEAIDLYRKACEAGAPFSGVIMDLTIPGGLGGRQAAEQILAEFPEASLIVSSGYSNDAVMSNYRDYGFIGAITKPYRINDFAVVLKSLPLR